MMAAKGNEDREDSVGSNLPFGRDQRSQGCETWS